MSKPSISATSAALETTQKNHGQPEAAKCDPPPYLKCIPQSPSTASNMSGRSPRDEKSKSPAKVPRRAGWLDMRIFPSNAWFETGICPQHKDLPWIATLSTNVKDLPGLMKQGFHWTEANVHRGEGVLVTNSQGDKWRVRPKWVASTKEFTCYRQFSLSSHHNRPYRRLLGTGGVAWTATLIVASTSMETLRDFRLSDLAVENVRAAHGTVGKGDSVYVYDALTSNNINCIYDDMPLDGWWPWPKRVELVDRL